MSRTSAWSRRDVLRNGLAAASGIFTPRSMLGLLGSGAAGAALSAAADYKALVCIYLYGGNDGFNTLLPYDDARFKRYSKIRGSLALPRDSLLPLSAAAADVDTYAVHPSMPEVAELYGAGRLAFIANVGPLLAPTSKADVLAGRNLPPRLNSHSDQQDCWMSSVPDAALRLGWGGRLADLLGSVNANPRLSMNISVSGNNLFQVGQISIPYTLATTGVPHFDALSTSDLGLRRTQVYRQLLVQAEAAHRFERADGRLLSRAIDLGMEVDTALQAAPALQTVFPDGNRLSDQLKMVARMISARDSLQLTRQVFFVTMGGFDTHDEQLPTQAFLLAQVSQSMQAFYKATVELGVQDAVTTFTASEFSRTLTSNGDGSDHAWGSVHCAFGGAVKGGNVYGRFPDQTLNGPDDSGGGHMIPTTSVEQYGAPMLRWFGADEDQIDTVFPHLSRFATRGLGFV